MDSLGGQSSSSSRRESSSKPPQSPSFSNSNSNSNNNGDGSGSFECNICFELAQDPIVTLCGHLFCWPCLYKWLHVHSHIDCPVCKALVREEKLIPLYGRGKAPTDPRSKSVPGVNIPNRPPGQRPETAPVPDHNHFPQQAFGFMGGPSPVMHTRFGNFTFSAWVGLLPGLFGFQMHGFPDGPTYGAAHGFPYGFGGPIHGNHPHVHHHHHHGYNPPSPSDAGQQAMLSKIFLLIGLAVIFWFSWT